MQYGSISVQTAVGGANLSGANLSEDTLHQISLASADLRGVNLGKKARRYTVDLHGANLKGVIMPDCTEDD
jgi:uncharacterized protein YjbI with pentapeptide repeats